MVGLKAGTCIVAMTVVGGLSRGDDEAKLEVSRTTATVDTQHRWLISTNPVKCEVEVV